MLSFHWEGLEHADTYLQASSMGLESSYNLGLSLVVYISHLAVHVLVYVMPCFQAVLTAIRARLM